ncbi:uncharacterized protein C5orf34 homolog [Pyxicephalus adspersus]|uniref:DUF4524 domain-containing protein n=1 Tax=Pyxicephalus adspersus TaxID=30357 RepID=A0AAV3ANK8_PYXAD|nr:TPA: hypothetical protein GDO54_014598 [Pyxicephalus adspersus]
MTMSAGCSLLLFCDDSVEVHYGDKGRLCLSPCGAEFMCEKPLPEAHPVHKPQRRRHRTEFVTSSCKDQVLEALNFRNTFALHPFLPSNLIPSGKRTRLMTKISEITWPSMEDDTGCVTRLEDGTVKVSSVDGHAHLYMSIYQQEFSVEYLCELSHSCMPKSQNKENPVSNDTNPANGKTKDRKNWKYSSCVLQEDSKSCATNHAFHYTWLVQRYSVASCPHTFQHAMNLALHFHRQSMLRNTDGSSDICTIIEDDESSKHLRNGAVSILPHTLPLSCPEPHLHRWNFSQSTMEQEDFLMTHPVPLKVVIYNGVLYRFFLDGPLSVEIYPGDGSVFRSEGDNIGKYFKHFYLNDKTGQVEDRLYTVRDLPPDKPRALYSVRSIISQARRFLELCCSKKLSLNSLSYTCCWKTESGADSGVTMPVVLEQCFMPDKGKFAVYSDNMVLASFIDGVVLFMIWSFTNFNKEEVLKDSMSVSHSSVQKHDHLCWCRLQFPNGASKLVELESPGEYVSYIRPAVAWCRSLDDRSQRNIPAPVVTENWLVEAELKKIQRFQFLLENGNTGSNKANVKLCSQPDNDDGLQEEMSAINIHSILEKTSKAIRDIDILLSSRK